MESTTESFEPTIQPTLSDVAHGYAQELLGTDAISQNPRLARFLAFLMLHPEGLEEKALWALLEGDEEESFHGKPLKAALRRVRKRIAQLQPGLVEVVENGGMGDYVRINHKRFKDALSPEGEEAAHFKASRRAQARWNRERARNIRAWVAQMSQEHNLTVEERSMLTVILNYGLKGYKTPWYGHSAKDERSIQSLLRKLGSSVLERSADGTVVASATSRRQFGEALESYEHTETYFKVPEGLALPILNENGGLHEARPTAPEQSPAATEPEPSQAVSSLAPPASPEGQTKPLPWPFFRSLEEGLDRGMIVVAPQRGVLPIGGAIDPEIVARRQALIDACVERHREAANYARPKKTKLPPRNTAPRTQGFHLDTEEPPTNGPSGPIWFDDEKMNAAFGRFLEKQARRRA